MPPVIPSHADLHTLPPPPPSHDSRWIQFGVKYTEKVREANHYVVFYRHDERDSVSLGET